MKLIFRLLGTILTKRRYIHLIIIVGFCRFQKPNIVHAYLTVRIEIPLPFPLIIVCIL